MSTVAEALARLKIDAEARVDDAARLLTSATANKDAVKELEILLQSAQRVDDPTEINEVETQIMQMYAEMPSGGLHSLDLYNMKRRILLYGPHISKTRTSCTMFFKVLFCRLWWFAGSWHGLYVMSRNWKVPGYFWSYILLSSASTVSVLAAFIIAVAHGVGYPTVFGDMPWWQVVGACTVAISCLAGLLSTTNNMREPSKGPADMFSWARYELNCLVAKEARLAFLYGRLSDIERQAQGEPLLPLASQAAGSISQPADSNRLKDKKKKKNQG